MNIPFSPRRLIIGVVAFLIVAGLAVLAYFWLSAPYIDNYKTRGGVRELSENAPLRVKFSQLMNKDSVEKNLVVQKYTVKEQLKDTLENGDNADLSALVKDEVAEDNFEIEKDVKGKLEWSGRTVTFDPDDEVEKGEIYRLTLKPAATSWLQQPLVAEYDEFFQIVEPPKVVLTTPYDGSVVPTDAKITVQFNRPMVALTGLDQGEDMFPQVKFEPNLRGRFKWMGTSSFQFIPEKIEYASQYKVSIPQGTEAIDGGVLEEDFVFSFETPAPEVTKTNPYNFDGLEGPNSTVLLTFNQPVEIGQLNRSVTMWQKKEKDDFWGGEMKDDSEDKGGFLGLFSGSGGNEDVEMLQKEGWEKVAITVEKTKEEEYRKEYFIGENYQFSGDSLELLEHTVTVKPRKSLPFDHYFLVNVSGDVKSTEGNKTSGVDHWLRFKTVGAPEATSVLPEGDTEVERRVIEIKMSNPMDEESLINHLEIKPPLKKADGKDQDLSPYLQADKTQLNLYPNLAPATEYTLTVKKGAEDIFGQKLVEDAVFKFKTGDYEPNGSLETRDDVMMLNGYKNPVFFANTTNIKNLTMRFKELTIPEYEELYSGGGYFNLYDQSPDDPFVTWTQPIEFEKNKKVTTKIDFAKEVGEELIPGIYYFDLEDNEKKDSFGDRQAFVMSKSTLAYKKSDSELLVWATDVADGQPIRDMEIVVKEWAAGAGENEEESQRRFVERFRGFTDQNGVAVFDLTQIKMDSPWSTFVVYGFKEGDFAMVESDWSDGIASWNFNIDSTYQQQHFYTYVYTDRPLYRPGHQVNFKGIVRANEDAVFSLPKIKEVPVVITDSRGKEVLKETFKLNEYGSFDGQVTLTDAAPIGEYSLIVTIPGEEEETFFGGFKVAEYRKPDYKVDISPDKKDYVNGETAKMKVDVDYYFGAPLAGADVHWTVQTMDYYFNEYDGEWYSFSEDGFFCYWGCEGDTKVVTSGRGQLNEQGEIEIELPLDIKDKKMSQLYKIEVTAEDVTKRSVSNRITFPVHKGGHYVGITNNDYVLKVGDDVVFDVITVDLEGKPVGNKKVDVMFNKREWNTVRKKNVDGDYYYTSGYEDTEIDSQTVTTDSNGKAKAKFNAPEGGLFKAIAESSDGQGNFVLAATSAYVSSGDFVFWGRDNNDRIELVPDKQEYKPGETAKVLIKSPYQGVKALVTYERGSILEHKIIDINSNSEVLEIPVDEKFIPNVFVSVMLVKGSEQTAGISSESNEGEVDKDLAEREIESLKVGYTTLFVDTLSKKLEIEVKTDKEKYGPGERVTINLQTTNVRGEGVPAEVSVAVVDKSVLALTDTVTADLINYFYRKRMLSVNTAHTLTRALARINVMVAQGLKGGGGGADGSNAVRSDFKDSAYWAATVKTNSEGEGKVSFELPDNLTTWQILAVGVTKDTLVGSEKTDFLVTKDVLVQAVLPRFMVVGDEMEVGVLLHNQTDLPIATEVIMEVDGAAVKNGSLYEEKDVAKAESMKYSKTVTVKANDKSQIIWPIKVMNVDQATFRFENEYDSIQIPVEVAPSSFPEVVATSGSLSDIGKQIEKIWVPRNVDPRFGGLTISMTPTMATSLKDGTDYLTRYPYGCSEQTASSLLPNVVLKRMLGYPIVPDNLVDTAELEKNVKAGMTRLYKFQNPNGGWGLWENSDPNPYLTAYVLFTMNEAKKAGYAVDETVMQSGVSYLKNYQFENSIEKDDFYTANTRAYMLYVLGEMNELDGDLGLANNLFDNREKLSIYAKALLAMALDQMWNQSGDVAVKKAIAGKIDRLKNDILNTQKVSPRSVQFEETNSDYRSFDSNGRTNAYVLQMLARTDSGNPVLDKLVTHILSARRDGHWRTTQETSITILALMDYFVTSKELEPAFTATALVNQTEQGSKVFSEENIDERKKIEVALDYLLPNNQDNEVSLSKVGKGKLYYDLELKYYLPLEQVEARDEGISVSQEYYELNDEKEENPLNGFELGQSVKGKMTVVVPEDRHYVVVEDWLPAGLEAIDFELATSEQAIQEEENKLNGWYWWNQLWHFNHHEIRDDRIAYFADYLPAGTYEIEYYARATSKGKFHDLPAQALEMYTPEVFGRTSGRMVEIR